MLLTGQIPSPPPKIPEKMLVRFPEMGDYNDRVSQFWGRFSDLLQRDLDEIKKKILELESQGGVPGPPGKDGKDGASGRDGHSITVFEQPNEPAVAVFGDLWIID